MKSSRFILFIISSLVFISCSNNKEVKINSSLFSTNSYKALNLKEKKKFLDSLQLQLSSLKNDSLFRSYLFDIAAEYYYINDYNNSLNVSRKITALSKTVKDTLCIGRSYYYIGDCYEISQRDSAYYYYYKAEKLFQINGNKEKLGFVFLKKANLLMNEGNYLESEIQASKLLQLLKQSSNYELLFSAYNVLGIDFERQEDYNNALKYYLLSKDILVLMKTKPKKTVSVDDYSLATSINIANVYQKKGAYNKAIQELKPIITNSTRIKWPKEYAIALANLGNVKMKSGDLKDVKNHFLNALAISKKNNYEDNELYDYIDLGEYFSLTKDTVNAIYYFENALQLARKIKDIDEIKIVLRYLAKMDHVDKFLYDEKYIKVSDSFAKAQRKNWNKYARIEYETSVVEDANKELSAKNTYILIGSLFSIFILVLIIIYRYVRSQKRELLFRITQQKAEEEIFELLKEYQIKLSEAKELEQNRISKELHDSVMNKLYGARMQLGVLNESDAREIKKKRLTYIDMLQDIEQEIRTISHDLHTDVIDAQFDYVSLLTNLIQQQNEIGATIFSFESDGIIDWNSINSMVKITIYRIVQEALSNVLKYAKAQHCKVIISLDENVRLQLIIIDDGKGFDVKNKTVQSIGLKNMKDRSLLLKAKFNINSELGIGTTINVVFIVN